MEEEEDEMEDLGEDLNVRDSSSRSALTVLCLFFFCLKSRLSLKMLPENLRKRINGLKFLAFKQNDLEAEYREAVYQLERQHHAKCAALFARREQIVNGRSEPSGEEGDYESDDEEEEADTEAPKIPDTDSLGVPAFWLTVLKQCPLTSELIVQKDVEVLLKLEDITVAYLDEGHVWIL